LIIANVIPLKQGWFNKEPIGHIQPSSAMLREEFARFPEGIIGLEGC
jgi:hypothetical protein